MLYLLSYSYLIKVFGCPIISSFFAEATAPSFANNGLKFLLKLFPLRAGPSRPLELEFLLECFTWIFTAGSKNSSKKIQAIIIFLSTGTEDS